MQMEERQQWQSWRINVHAKNFSFKLRAATSLVPNCNFSRFSLSLKLRKFVFKVDSDPIEPFSHKNTSLKTSVVKFLKRFSQKFRPRIAKKGPFVIKKASTIQHPKLQDPIGIGLWVVGFLAFLAQFICKRDEKGIMILTCVGFLVASLFKTCKRGKYMMVNIAVVLVLMAALVARFQFLDLDLENCYWNFLGKYASEQAKKAWKRFNGIGNI